MTELFTTSIIVSKLMPWLQTYGDCAFLALLNIVNYSTVADQTDYSISTILIILHLVSSNVTYNRIHKASGHHYASRTLERSSFLKETESRNTNAVKHYLVTKKIHTMMPVNLENRKLYHTIKVAQVYAKHVCLWLAIHFIIDLH